MERLAKPRNDAASRPILPSAAVVLTPDGAPIRSVLTGRRVMVTGFYNSRKAGRALPYEGMNELALLKRSEVDTQVVDYRSQPFRFEFVLDGAKRIYIADCVRLLDDGSIEVIEVKGDPRQLQAPAYAESYLNCFPRDLSWLLAEGHLSKSLRRDEVVALGGSVINSREISWRWRVSPALRDGLANEHDIKRVLGPFWSRIAVEAYFSKRFPLGRPS